MPREVVNGGLNAVELRFAVATSPESVGLSRDARELAVRFDQIEFRRRG